MVAQCPCGSDLGADQTQRRRNLWYILRGCIIVHVVEYGVPSPKKKAVHAVLTHQSAQIKQKAENSYYHTAGGGHGDHGPQVGLEPRTMQPRLGLDCKRGQFHPSCNPSRIRYELRLSERGVIIIATRRTISAQPLLSHSSRNDSEHVTEFVERTGKMGFALSCSVSTLKLQGRLRQLEYRECRMAAEGSTRPCGTDSQTVNVKRNLNRSGGQTMRQIE